jgi:GntR family transcriptional regulator, transcriptional repressor for pyruvate dehydrogenase complex
LIRRRTLTAQVIEHVLSLIKSGQVKTGESLPTEKDLTTTLGVSRTCVREGMKSLEFLRLVHIRPKVGAIVLEASPAAMLTAEYLLSGEGEQKPDALLEFRKIIEAGVVSLAAEKATLKEIAAIKKALKKYEKEIASGKVDYHTDISFHAEVAAASKNPLVIMVWEIISSQLGEIFKYTIEMPKVPEESLRDHRQILRAIEEHNPAKARAAMRSHLEHAQYVWRVAGAQLASNPTAAQKEPALVIESR